MEGTNSFSYNPSIDGYKSKIIKSILIILKKIGIFQEKLYFQGICFFAPEPFGIYQLFKN